MHFVIVPQSRSRDAQAVGTQKSSPTLSGPPVGSLVAPAVIDYGVIVNEVVAASKGPSDPVAVTMYEAPAPLTVNVQSLKVPVVPEAHELADPIVPPPEIVNVIVTSAVNPLPDAVTVTPLSPCVGVRVTAGVVTVNVAVGVAFELTSVA